MSREQYTAPNTSGSQQAPATGFAQSTNFEDTNRPVAYLCGDCDTKVTLKRGDPIRCKECGYRVLYKQRTNRYVYIVLFADEESAKDGISEKDGC